MTATIVLGAASVLVALACAVAHVKKVFPLKFIFKTIASFLFVLAAALALRSNEAAVAYAVSMLIALVLGMLGDIFLMMDPFVPDKKKQGMFYALGGAAFVAGHVFYIVLFFGLEQFNVKLLPLLLVLPLVLLFLTKVPLHTPKTAHDDEDAEASVTENASDEIVSADSTATEKISLENDVSAQTTADDKPRKRPLLDVGVLAYAFMVYSVILGLMVLSALNVYLVRRDTFGLLLLIASLCFAISDTTLALNDFAKVKLPGGKYLFFVVIVFYYVAQALFATSILLI